jgi:hypothetical protein
VYQWAIRSHAKGSASEVRENFGNTCKTISSKIDHERWEIQLSRQVSCYSSPHCRYQELKDADGEFWRLKTVRVLSLVVKTLFSSCLDRIELFLLNTDPCF